MSEAMERQAIAALMQDYFDGLYFSDTARLRKVFHPEAHYFTASDGQWLHYDMPQYLPVVDARPAPAAAAVPRSDRIVSIDFAGPATALVKAECSIPPKHFVDLLSLLKIDGRWQIVAKVFHFEVRESSGR